MKQRKPKNPDTNTLLRIMGSCPHCGRTGKVVIERFNQRSVVFRCDCDLWWAVEFNRIKNACHTWAERATREADRRAYLNLADRLPADKRGRHPGGEPKRLSDA